MEALTGLWTLLSLVATTARVASVTVMPTNPVVVLGIDTETEIHIRVEAPSIEDALPPRVFCNVGTIGDLARVGPREFVARYILPTDRFPQVALLVASFDAEGLRGSTMIRLRATTSLPLRTDPGAQLSVSVGEKVFGPLPAPPDGQVNLPVVVSPGVAFGIARSVNQYGKVTEQTIDLRLPDFPRIVAVAPLGMAFGTTAEIAIYAIDQAGLPAASDTVWLRSDWGRPEPLGGEPGENRFLVSAPQPSRATKLTLRVGLQGDSATESTVEIPLHVGKPARLTLRPDHTHLAIGRASSVLVFITAEDAFGNAIPAAGASLFVDGKEVPVRVARDGRTLAVVSAPARFDGRQAVVLEGALATTYARHTLPLGNLPDWWLGPARPPRATITPRMGLLWNLHQPAGTSLFIDALIRPSRWASQAALGLAAGYLRSHFPVGDGTGSSDVRLGQIPLLAIARTQFQPHPRVEISGGGGAGISFARADVSTFGATSSGRAVSSVVETSVETTVRFKVGHLVLGTRYLWAGVGRLSSNDTIAGNTAGLLIDLGYRLVL